MQVDEDTAPPVSTSFALLCTLASAGMMQNTIEGVEEQRECQSGETA
jgi:hypothetical protein